jgi:hypothetical protein
MEGLKDCHCLRLFAVANVSAAEVHIKEEAFLAASQEGFEVYLL